MAPSVVPRALLGLTLGGQVAALAMLAGVPLPLKAGFAVLAFFTAGALVLPPRPVLGAWRSGAKAAIVGWGAWVAVYFATGALAAGRAVTFPRFFEDQLPFLPALTLVYLGVHPLFLGAFFSGLPDERLARLVRAAVGVVAVSGAVWLLFPVALPRFSLLPGDALFGRFALAQIWATDPTANCLPSTHCAMAVLAAFAFREVWPRLSPWLFLTAVMIGVSTVLVRQHYAVDVAAGWTLGGVAGLWFSRRG